MKLPRWFQKAVLSRVWLCFLVMGLAFFVFGVGSLNLFYLLRANTNFVFENGWSALAEGGGEQLAELLITGYLSMAAYVVFKACEYRLAHWLGDPPDTAPQDAQDSAHPAAESSTSSKPQEPSS